tara:strand:+ start:1254 stop:1460 length:207 start_codon:yes stop_codon:yes gene_type:complete
MNPKMLFDAITKPLKNVNKIGINFFLNAPSIKKNVKNTRFNIETGLPPWNIPFEVPENLYDSRPNPKK